MEWRHTQVPYGLRCDFDVWLSSGQVRRVKVAETFFGGYIRFMDCTHPAQKSYCEPSTVLAWKIDSTSPAV